MDLRDEYRVDNVDVKVKDDVIELMDDKILEID
jgi:hypothetical protein